MIDAGTVSIAYHTHWTRAVVSWPCGCRLWLCRYELPPAPSAWALDQAAWCQTHIAHSTLDAPGDRHTLGRPRDLGRGDEA